MNSLLVPDAIGIDVSDDTLTFDLSDDRTISVPMIEIEVIGRSVNSTISQTADALGIQRSAEGTPTERRDELIGIVWAMLGL